MTDAPDVELVLASSSPQRRALLRESGIPFRAVDPPIPEPEHGPQTIDPSRRAEALAYFKASAVRNTVDNPYVLGADTIVALGAKILGKPADEPGARLMLRDLSGSRHEVITGVALLGRRGQRLIASEITHVTMRPMTRDEIEQYIASGEWIDKAGAYAIQETADRFVESVEGSFTNVVGLPLELVRRMLREIRIRSQAPGPPSA